MTNKKNYSEKISMFFSKLKFWKKDRGGVSTKTGGGAKAFLSKLSGAFLLPISVLAIAGLFLGVGSSIAGVSQDPQNPAVVFGNFLKELGNPLFGAMPLLFAAAIAVSFTDEAGVGVFNAIIGYLIFSGLQTVFVQPVTDGDILVGYKVLFSGEWREAEDLKYLVGSTLGFNVLQTSVFGGIIVGFIVQWAYNKFHTIQLPQIISFFGGKRFVALAVVVFMIPLSFIFLLLWPYIGYIFNWIGENSGKIPYGFDSFIFGYIERILVPFGLHHVFYSPLWYTSAGGNVPQLLLKWLSEDGNKINALDLAAIAKQLGLSDDKVSAIRNLGDMFINFNNLQTAGVTELGTVVGDSTTSIAMIGVNVNQIKYSINDNEYSKPLFLFIQDELGLKLGRFLQGKYSFMQWGLPAAAVAMIFAAPKENRKVALGTIFPAAVTCFVTGVTEPLEFTFLFLAPWLFFGFHAFMCAVSFLLANVLSVHIAMAFSGGFIDLIIYGIIPVLKGTNFWWTIVVGMGFIPIYFFVFYFWIKKADLPTPGRGGNTKLFTKKDYQASKTETSNNNGIDPQVLDVIIGFGGRSNIVKTANCATRLRFDVKDASLVSEEKLKASGAFGLRKISDSHVQVIFGPVADQLRIKIDKAIEEIDKNPSIINNVKKSNNIENSEKNQINNIKNSLFEVCSPAEGKIKTLSSLKDGVFSEKMLGDGVAIESVDGKIYAPISGKLVTVFPTKHAYGIQNNDGLNVLIHIGIDTVSLNGKGFTSYVKQDQIVKQGELIAKVDLSILKKHKLISDVICVVTTDSQLQPKSEDIRKQGQATKNTIIISNK